MRNTLLLWRKLATEMCQKDERMSPCNTHAADDGRRFSKLSSHRLLSAFAMAFMSVMIVTLLSTVVYAENVQFKSSRKVAADVTEIDSGKGLRISVAFIPVSTLTEASNERISRLMAQSFAERTVSGYLHAPKTILFPKAKIVSFEFPKSNYERICKVVYEIPKTALLDIVVKKNKVSDLEDTWEIFKKACMTESKYAMDDFRSDCYRDLRLAEAAFMVEIAQRERTLESVREEIETSFSAIIQRVDSEDMLLMSEKEELSNKIQSVRSFLLRKLEERHLSRERLPVVRSDKVLYSADDVKRNDREDKLPILNAVFQEPFGEFLKNDPILLLHGGARFIKIDDGATAILAVGYAASDNENREDVAELEASAALGKLQGGEETLVNNKYEDAYLSVSMGGETKENVKMIQSYKVSVNSMDFHKTGETVGTWLSADGKRFFLAKGRIVRKQPKEGGDQ